ncbi:Fimh-like protein [hydrothermal vent metagenome]|uniref:Fimh-like protein n=1 Tax=hydrothermal vent metagenome TaxID=652676 RepID=A0A1W1BRS3_9ZZZZ
MKIILFVLTLNLAFASNILIDKKTKLIWQDNTSLKYIKKDWQGAINLCKNLNLSGHTDWRLPSIKELESILKTNFKNIGGSEYYWSSTQHESSKEFAYMMNFKRSYEYNNYKTYERYVRCVRGE